MGWLRGRMRGKDEAAVPRSEDPKGCESLNYFSITSHRPNTGLRVRRSNCSRMFTTCTIYLSAIFHLERTIDHDSQPAICVYRHSGLRYFVTHIHNECQHVLVPGRRQSSDDNVGYIAGVPAVARNDA